MDGDDRVDSLGWALCATIDVVLIVFDVTNRQSFESVQGWMDAMTTVRPSSGDLPTFLIGNKMEALTLTLTLAL
jgi:GTPase SAR1 family protein